MVKKKDWEDIAENGSSAKSKPEAPKMSRPAKFVNKRIESHHSILKTMQSMGMQSQDDLYAFILLLASSVGLAANKGLSLLFQLSQRPKPEPKPHHEQTEESSKETKHDEGPDIELADVAEADDVESEEEEDVPRVTF